MYKSILPLLILVLFSITHADNKFQNDWSGGPGIMGPSGYWGNWFYLESRIEWDSIPGQVSLQYDVDYLVVGNFNGASSVYSEDIDGDGDMDVLGAAAGDDEITWWENEDGSGTSWIEHTVDADFQNARSIFAEDIDGDGDLDVLSASVDDNEIMWWENEDGSGTSWIKHIVDGYFEYPRCIYSADIDGDGDMDVLGAGYDTDNITWWENENGSGTSWVKHTVDGDFQNAHSVFAEDIDDDGYMDIIGGGAGGYSAWWENIDGSGTSWNKHIVGGGVRSICAVDIDGDCYMDILGATASNAIKWWENEDGSGISWIEHVIDPFYDDAISVYYKDLDSDGDIDVLGASYDDEITWWANSDTGAGIYWVEHIIDGEFNGAYSVYSEDINGDGEMDVLGAALQADKIVWWDINVYSSNGSLESIILYLRNDPEWGALDWYASTPAGTDVSFLVRASDNYKSMGPWSDTLTAPCSLYGILDDYDSFFQYMVLMSTEAPGISTPILYNVQISYNSLCIDETAEPTPSGTELLSIVPNPTVDSPNIRFGLSERSSVDISIFDLSGHLVSEIHGDDYSMGFHDVLMENLSPGIYFCRMISGDFTATQRFVVIE